MTSPYGLARKECANYQKGRCLGFPVPFPKPGLVPSPASGDPCIFKDQGNKRCGYFEQCLLAAPRYADIAEQYHTVRGGQAPRGDVRRCPDCGKPLRPRKRVCADCRERRRRAATRKAVAKHRSDVSS